MTRKAIVVGGGFGGMAASIRARAQGYEVILVDRSPQLGGKAAVYEKDGFRHDAGPTVITAPFLFAELFELLGERLEDHVKLVPLNPWYRFWFQDGEVFNYGGTVEDTLAEIRRFDERDVDGYLNLLNRSKEIFDVGFTQLASEPFNDLGMMVKQIPQLLQLRGDKSVWQFVSHHLKNSHLRKAFSIQPLLVGGNPFDTTCIYSLIHYLERKWGIFFPLGGTGGLVAALDALMRRHGIEIMLSQEIERIQIEQGHAKAVVLQNGEEIHGDIIVANTDAPYLYTRMIDPGAVSLSAKLKVTIAKYSMGLFVLYFGTRKKYDELAHHTIWMGQRYRSLLDDIFNKKVLPEDFSLYIHRPTATDPSFAPEGCDSFYVLCPVPNLKGSTNWAVEGPRLRDRIVTALNQTVMPGLKEVITGDFFKTPIDFRDDHLSLHGAAFSIAPLFSQSAWFRFHNKAEGISNLYLVGAGCHPGAGLPGVLCSAKVFDALLEREML
jgi:phytoene desaturase